MNIPSRTRKKYNGHGLIFNVQRFSLHDGPGIRTLVFLKGCPLRCLWCANPEGLSQKDQVLYHRVKCKRCGKCLKCPESAIYEQDGFFLTDQSKCVGCGRCTKLCVYGARTMTNRYVRVEEVVDMVLRDKVFYKHSSGGLTLGGGDPMFQPDFAYDVLKLAKEKGVNTAIETSAFGKETDFLNMVSLCDNIFIDLKAVINEQHKRLTGRSNTCILRNIRAYDAATRNEGGRMVFRIPLIADCNGDDASVKAAGDFVKSLQGQYKVEILPFHNFGESKYEQLCMEYEFKERKNMKTVEADPYLELLASMGLDVSINTH